MFGGWKDLQTHNLQTHSIIYIFKITRLARRFSGRRNCPQPGYTVVSREFSSVQLSPSVMSDSATPRTAARQASLSITNSQSLLKLMSIDMSYYNKSKECLKVVKILLDPLP